MRDSFAVISIIPGAQGAVALKAGRLDALEVAECFFNGALVIAMLAMIALAGSQIAIPV